MAGKRLPAQVSELPTQLLDYERELRVSGKAPETVETIIKKLKRFNKQCDINNPYKVKEKLSELDWKNKTKKIMTVYFSQYFKFIGKTWTAPIYREEETLPFIPTEQEINALIASSHKKYATYLQILKETGMRTSELMLFKWTDIDTQRLTVNVTPTKGSTPRILPITPKLLAMINQLERKTLNICAMKKRSFRSAYEKARSKTAKKLNNPRLQRITLHTFRHWKGTIEYHKTKDVLHVKRILGHKEIESTLVYINVEQALFLQDGDEWTSIVTNSICEETKAINAGFQLVRSINEETAIYKKRK